MSYGPFHPKAHANRDQVAYLMADISSVDTATIKDLYERLESLSCMMPNNLKRPIQFLRLTGETQLGS